MSFFVLRKISMVENLLFFLGMIRGETDKPPIVGVESTTHRSAYLLSRRVYLSKSKGTWMMLNQSTVYGAWIT